MQKREFLKATGTLLALAPLLHVTDLSAKPGEFTLPPLPYAPAALEPNIDGATMALHHDKHHAGYVKKLNELLLTDTALSALTLAQLIAKGDTLPLPVRNNAGGHFNHSFFWPILSPTPTTPNGSALEKALVSQFGSVNEFKSAFDKAAGSQFGSGWAWLIKNKSGKLEICTTPNQDNPLMKLKGVPYGVPIIGLDVWEHAYYLLHQNRRPEYFAAFWKVLDWNQAARNFKLAKV